MTIENVATIRDKKIGNIFRNLHQYTKEDTIQSYDEESTEMLVLSDFEMVIDQLIEDFKSIEKGREAVEWFNVDDEFSLEELEIAKNEMVSLRNNGLISMTVFSN